MDHDDSMLSTPSSNNDIDESLITNPAHDENNDMDEDNDNDEETDNANSNNKIGRPQTPQNDHLNAAAPGELSPPRSQRTANPQDHNISKVRSNVATGGAFDEDDLDLSPTNPNLGVAGSTTTGGGFSSSSQDPATTATTTITTTGNGNTNEWKAGYGWKNKKAQIEMQKAWEGFSDRDFSLKQYGDVLTHRIGVDPTAARS